MVRKGVLVVGLSVLLVASVLAYESSQRPRSIDYASKSMVVHSPVNNGLELTATIQQIYLKEGQNLSVIAEVNNTLSTPLTLNATIIENPASGPCAQGSATGIRVYMGHYSAGNLTQAQELWLYNPSLVYYCPAAWTLRYTFAPNSDMATVQQSLGGFQGHNETGLVNETSTVGGYWVGSGQNYVFHTFPVRQYTVLVFDAWGDEALAYFEVVS